MLAAPLAHEIGGADVSELARGALVPAGLVLTALATVLLLHTELAAHGIVGRRRTIAVAALPVALAVVALVLLRLAALT